MTCLMTGLPGPDGAGRHRLAKAMPGCGKAVKSERVPKPHGFVREVLEKEPGMDPQSLKAPKAEQIRRSLASLAPQTVGCPPSRIPGGGGAECTQIV
jgi:hypothetical protein